MHYQIISFSHKHCDLALREKIALTQEQGGATLLKELAVFDYIDEIFTVSTCNRLEFILYTKDPFASFHTVLGLLAKQSGSDFYTLKNSVKTYVDKEAIAHFFGVIASLDSLVVGESQITGQVKEGYRKAQDLGVAGAMLSLLMQAGIGAAAKIRQETTISSKPVSIASVAVAKAKELMGEAMQGSTALVVGAGEMGILTAKHLLRQKADVVLLGRDELKVKRLALELGENVKPATIDKLQKYINRYRLLFSATASSAPIITQSMIEDGSVHRIWFDLALPRDIDEVSLDTIDLYRIDDLKAIAESNSAKRQEALFLASRIVEEEVERFFANLTTVAIEPIIASLWQKADEAIEKSLMLAIKKGFIDKASEANTKKTMQNAFKRFLHDTLKKVRDVSTDEAQTDRIDALACLFDLQPKSCKSDKHTDKYKGS